MLKSVEIRLDFMCALNSASSLQLKVKEDVRRRFGCRRGSGEEKCGPHRKRFALRRHKDLAEPHRELLLAKKEKQIVASECERNPTNYNPAMLGEFAF